MPECNMRMKPLLEARRAEASRHLDMQCAMSGNQQSDSYGPLQVNRKQQLLPEQSSAVHPADGMARHGLYTPVPG